VNKVVAILGIVVLITLGGLFFCAGFFTGTHISPTQASLAKEGSPANTQKGISLNDVESVMDTKSETISEKIMGILSSSTETSQKSDVVDKKNMPVTGEESTKVSIDSLLREIAANHATNDDCSPKKTLSKMKIPTPINPNSLQGKRIVFIGYFKNKIALEVQKLLVGKGYRAHVESSKIGDNESFIFCGPFKKEKNAEKLVKWLRKHDFKEARLVSVSRESIEETLYDAINDDSGGPPENSEKDIPEA
jgi:cell division septation protein DedD